MASGMEHREGTPISLVLEMYAVVFWAPVLVLLTTSVAFALIFTRRSNMCVRRRVIVGIVVLCLALPLTGGSVAYGFLTLLDHPRYRAHVVCDPCF
jgi:hypothetical protein